ncbi:MAG: family 3 glycosyl hydrolase [Planctomycetia bacterium]|nr:family 3 glycosyl hydrolase [Planctomycetia bacterium]
MPAPPIALVALVLVTCLGSTAGAVEPYRDPALPLEQRLDDAVARLSLAEKAALLNHRGSTVKSLGLRADQWNQCLHGIMWDRPATLFPVCVAMAATWNPDLVGRVATALSDEARGIFNGWHLDPRAPGEHKGLIYRAPVINIGRNPYWGRNHEAWGEDPFLTGRMAVAYVRGLNGDDPRHLKIAATLKHFAVNNVESGRTKLDARVSERMLRDYWLPHWRDAVVEGGAQSVMASYNAINGVPNNINHWLLTDLLKEEWGHKGFVVSDLGGVKTMVEGHGGGTMDYVDAVARSLAAGCDFSDQEYEKQIPPAVERGKLSLERLDDAVRRVLRVRMQLGEFDPFESVVWSRIPPDVVHCRKHRDLARDVARQAIVLLQNRPAGQAARPLLPLDPAAIRKIAVIGPLADVVQTTNYFRMSGKPVPAAERFSPLAGIRGRLPGVDVIHAPGCRVKPPPAKDRDGNATEPHDEGPAIAAAAAVARAADVAVVVVGTDETVEHEGRDRKTLALTGRQEELVQAVLAANPRTVVVLASAGPLAVPTLAEHVPAMLQSWWSGGDGGTALAEVLFGDANPAGRLPHTVYASDAQVPPQDEYDISKGFTFMYVTAPPLYPFGHGLSFTRFEYAGLEATGSPLTVTATVTNTGGRAGDEVAQLYLVPPRADTPRPRRMLRGFTRVSLAPGESIQVRFTVPDEKLAFWNPDTGAFDVQRGEWGVEVGASSADIRLRARVTR